MRYASRIPVPDPGPGTSASLVERGLTVFGLLWQVAYLAVTAFGAILGLGSVMASVLLAPWVLTVVAVAAALVGPLAARRQLPLLRLINVGGLVALTVVTTALTSAPIGVWNPGIHIAVIAATVSGLTLPWRWATALVGGIAVIGALELLAETPFGAGDLLFPAYALATGGASIVLTRALRHAARRVDDAHDGLVEARAHEAVVEQAAERDRAAERTIHDTLLNTLDAIARGGLLDRTRMIQERCAFAAQGIRSITRYGVLVEPDAASEREVMADIAVAAADLRGTGVDVRVDLADALTGLPATVASALGAAVVESLRNVERHAHARRVTVVGRRRRGALIVRVDDDGTGMAHPPDPGRLGIAGTVTGGLAAVGGMASVDFTGEGTRVILRWSPNLADESDRDIAADVTGALARALPAFLAIFLGYGAIVLAATWTLYVDPWISLAAFVLVALAAVPLGLRPDVAARWGFSGDLDPPARAWAPVAVSAVVAVVVMQAEQWAIRFGDPARAAVPEWSMWSSEVALALLFATVLLGPRGTIIVVLAAWVVGQGGDIWELARAGSLTLIVAAIFAWSFRRRARQYARAVRSAWESQSRLIAHRDQSAIIADRFSALGRYTLPLIEGLAEGRLDAADPQVQQSCAREERFARSLVRLDPAAGTLTRWMRDLVLVARHLGLGVDAQVIGPDRPTPLGPPTTLSQVLGHLPKDSAPRLTGTWEGEVGVLRLVAPGVGAAASVVPPVDVDEDGTAWWEEVVADGDPVGHRR